MLVVEGDTNMAAFTHTGTVIQIEPISETLCRVVIRGVNGIVGEYFVSESPEGYWPKYEATIKVWGTTDGEEHHTESWIPA
jgi:hypothetical protein